jgi:hypothetical protein
MRDRSGRFDLQQPGACGYECRRPTFCMTAAGNAAGMGPGYETPGIALEGREPNVADPALATLLECL